MELQPFVDDLREQLLAAAGGQGQESRAAAERMTATIDAAAHLVLLEALSAAADEITVDLAPGWVQVRLRGRDPEFAVTSASESGPAFVSAEPTASPASSSADADDSTTARMTLRLPEALKLRVEQASARESLSVNAWLVRAISRAADAPHRAGDLPPSSGQSFTGWVR